VGSNLYLSEISGAGSKEQLHFFHTVAAGFAVSSLLACAFLGWLPTPSYNSLVMQALLITTIGLPLAKNIPSGEVLSAGC